MFNSLKKRTIIAFLLMGGLVAALHRIWMAKYAKHFYVFQPELFVIICILAFLLIYKLTDYMADFKTLKEKSRIEIVFLSIFFVFLFIPMSYINQEVTSKKECRNLAVWKPLITQNGGLNYTFGSDFESWFNDRFNLRYYLISIHRAIMFKFASHIFEEGEIGYNKKAKAGFYKDWNKKAIETDMGDFKDEIANLKKLKEFCDKNKIKLYVTIAPNKGDVYPEIMEKVIPLNRHNSEIFKNLTNKEIKNLVIFPLNDYIEASKKDYVFTGCDTHWSEYGAFIGYQALMNRIKKDYPKLRILNENDFVISRHKGIRVGSETIYHKGFFCDQLPIKDKRQYATYNSINKDNLTVLDDKIELLRTDTHMKNTGNNLRVFILGNSFSESIWHFLKYTFAYTVKRRYNATKEMTNSLSMQRFEKEILKEKPDILIISISSHTISDLKELY